MPNQPKTPARAFRIPDSTMDKARAKAERLGVSLSEIVRELLDEWADRPER